MPVMIVWTCLRHGQNKIRRTHRVKLSPCTQLSRCELGTKPYSTSQNRITFLFLCSEIHSFCAKKRPRGRGGHSPEKVVWVCPAVKTPHFMPLPLFFRSPVAAWFSSLDPTLSKNIKFWLLWAKFVKKLKNFQLCDINLAQISVHKPSKCWKFPVPFSLLCKISVL